MPDASLEVGSRRLALLMLAAFAVGFALGRPEALALAGLLAGLSSALRAFRPERRAVEWGAIGLCLLRLGLGVALGLGVDAWSRSVSAGALLVSLALKAALDRRAATAFVTRRLEPATDAFSMLVGALALEHRVAPGAWVSVPGVLFCLLAVARVPVGGAAAALVLSALAVGFSSDHPAARAVLLIGITSASLYLGATLLGRLFARLR